VGGEADPAPPRPVPLNLQVTSCTPRLVNLDSDKTCTFAYYLNQEAHVRLTVKDWDGDEVVAIEKKSAQGNGQLAWDLKPTNGDLYDGLYTYQVEAWREHGQRSVYAPGLAGALDSFVVQEFFIDLKTRAVRYTLPKIGMVRVRLYRDEMFVKTLLDWTPQLAGPQVLSWDGNDASGNPIRLTDRNAKLRANAYSLPENAFSVAGAGRTKPPRPFQAQRAWQTQPALAQKYFFARMPREQRHDPRLSLTFLSEPDCKPVDVPLRLSAPIQVRLTAHADDVGFLVDERFEVCVYVDGGLLFEDEDGTIPFTFRLDPNGLNPGTHHLNVVAITTAGHDGAVACHFEVATDRSTRNRGEP
jgi:hypothetical protein